MHSDEQLDTESVLNKPETHTKVKVSEQMMEYQVKKLKCREQILCTLEEIKNINEASLNCVQKTALGMMGIHVEMKKLAAAVEKHTRNMAALTAVHHCDVQGTISTPTGHNNDYLQNNRIRVIP
ncbi:hypothetical protein ACJ72_08002 [Emergomyces africanus]|uniref:Uncharacterized protein n=1 Tax=Emergomyces africanus TaxID=1955775 RepID=A0A1B7NLY7_9EURO|nr:hypothetical protein ACJ72_08002 [Emergomyces africanus]